MPCDIMSYHTVPYYITLHRIVSYHTISYLPRTYYIVSHRMTFYCIVSYRIVSYHNTSQHTPTYDIVLRQIVVCDAISYHLCHIICCDRTSCNIVQDKIQRDESRTSLWHSGCHTGEALSLCLCFAFGAHCPFRKICLPARSDINSAGL